MAASIRWGNDPDALRQARLSPAEGKAIEPAGERNRARVLCVYLLLFLATLAVYSPVRHFDFVNFDDPEYVTEKQPRARGTDVGRCGLGVHFL